MNREETKQAIAVMQAYVDGEEIEIKCINGAMVSAGYPCWDWESSKYRVKPKPREYWLVEWATSIFAFAKEVDARDSADRYGGEIIHVREVEK